MTSKDEVAHFLRDFGQKMRVFSILYRDDRGKNAQTLSDLELRPSERDAVISSLTVADYSEGPLPDTLYKNSEMWIFGKSVKDAEVYIKITLGSPNLQVICISFHIADHPIAHPYQEATS